jgi:hypothetical protein
MKKEEWQASMDAAPRDGTVILGYGVVAGEVNGPGDFPEGATIQWDGGRTDYPGFEWRVTNTDAYAAWQNPTHWMWLPDPPLDVTSDLKEFNPWGQRR